MPTNNFAIVRNMFGNLWIGTTLLPVKKGSIFANFKDAVEEAKNLLIMQGAEDDDIVDFEADNAEEFLEPAVEEFIIRR